MFSILSAAAVLQLTTPAADPRIEAFRTACLPHNRDNERAAAALAANGWAEAPEDDHPELAASVAMVREDAADPEYPMELTYSIWRREIEGRRLYIVLNRVHSVMGKTEDSDGDGVIQSWETASDLTLLGCGVWDFDESSPIDPARVTAWLEREPVQIIDQPGVISGGTWNVFGLIAGTGEIHVGHLPEGTSWPFTGVSITMTSAP